MATIVTATALTTRDNVTFGLTVTRAKRSKENYVVCEIIGSVNQPFTVLTEQIMNVRQWSSIPLLGRPHYIEPFDGNLAVLQSIVYLFTSGDTHKLIAQFNPESKTYDVDYENANIGYTENDVTLETYRKINNVFYSWAISKLPNR